MIVIPDFPAGHTIALHTIALIFLIFVVAMLLVCTVLVLYHRSSEMYLLIAIYWIIIISCVLLLLSFPCTDYQMISWGDPDSITSNYCQQLIATGW